MLKLTLVIAAILASGPLAYFALVYGLQTWPVPTMVLSTGAMLTVMFASALYETKREDK